MAKGFYGFGVVDKDNKPLMEGSSPIIDEDADQLGVIAAFPATAKMDIAPCRVVSLFWSDEPEDEL